MTKRALKFGRYSTASDGWTLAALTLAYPERRVCDVELPYADGSIDLMDAISDEPRYSVRELTATLELSGGTREERTAKIRKIINAYHGRTVHIGLPDDSDYLLTGRLSFAVQYNDRAHAAVNISAICQPWRNAAASRIVKATVSASAAVTVTLPNDGGKRLAPTITVDSDNDITITLENYTTVTLSSGTTVLPELQIPPGGTSCTLSGVGTVSFRYVEAIL